MKLKFKFDNGKENCIANFIRGYIRGQMDALNEKFLKIDLQITEETALLNILNIENNKSIIIKVIDLESVEDTTYLVSFIAESNNSSFENYINEFNKKYKEILFFGENKIEVINKFNSTFCTLINNTKEYLLNLNS